MGVHPKPNKNVGKQVESSEKKSIKSIRERSSSRSSRGKNANSILFNYITNRIDGSTKGWNVLRVQNKTGYTKKPF